MRAGRPAQFLFTVVLLWVGARLSGVGELEQPSVEAIFKSRQASAVPLPFLSVVSSTSTRRIRHTLSARQKPARQFAHHLSPDVPPEYRSASLSPVSASAPAEARSAFPVTAPPTPQENRWSASAWLFLREGSRIKDISGAGLLGGSQAGVRLAYTLLPDAPSSLQAFARVSTALQRPSSGEAALGLALFPSNRLPAYVAIERHNRLSSGGRNAFALYAAASLPPKAIAERLHLDGYAQGGMIGLNRMDGFIDGRFSLMRSDQRDRFRLGASLSGATQPGLSRLDIGPRFEVPLQLNDGSIRTTLEWRQRISGNASPGSGLAVTLGTDF